MFNFFPVKLNGIILAVFVITAGQYLSQEYLNLDKESVLVQLLTLLLKLLFVFSVLILSLAAVSIILVYVHFLLIRKNYSRSLIKLKFGDSMIAQAGNTLAEIILFSTLRPLLGVVKIRLIFADNSLSEEIVLEKDYFFENKYLRKGICAYDSILLHDRKEYWLNGVIVYFEDMFRILSIPFLEKETRKFIVIPPKKQAEELALKPNKTEEQTERIEIPQKIQGELINYKNFESGDDIRRIVWKIFAKNKELVVRIPETTDPYASHIFLYVSYFNHLGDALSQEFDKEFLNFYKDKLSNIYTSIAKIGYQIKYIDDQQRNINFSKEKEVVLDITNSNWQNNIGIKQLIGTGTSGVFVISSLVDANELVNAMHNKQKGSVIMLVKLSELFDNKPIFNLWSILFKLNENPLTRLKRNWIWSGYRRKVLKNEKLLEKTIDNILFN